MTSLPRLAAAGMLLAGMATAQTFEAVSIKPAASGLRGYSIRPYPDRLSCGNVSLRMLIAAAYHVYDFQVSGGPKWTDDDRFDLEAKAASGVSEKQLFQMLQPVLAERFHLEIRKEDKDASVFLLEVAKTGLKLQPSADETPVVFRVQSRSRVTAQHAPVAYLTETLSQLLGRPVLDRTSLSGVFDYKVEWSPDEVQIASNEAKSSPDGPWPGLTSALQEQLGLRLRSAKAPVENIAIEKAEKPTAN